MTTEEKQKLITRIDSLGPIHAGDFVDTVHEVLLVDLGAFGVFQSVEGFNAFLQRRRKELLEEIKIDPNKCEYQRPILGSKRCSNPDGSPWCEKQTCPKLNEKAEANEY